MIKPIVINRRELKRLSVLVLLFEEIGNIITDLEDTFAKLNGYGLVANQIGYLKGVAIIRGKGVSMNLINPKILEKEG